MNELIYQQGGTLYLDEPFEAQPSAATITITDLYNQPLTSLGGGFAAIADEACDLDDLVLVLPATNANARVIVPTTTSGTIPLTMTTPGYKLLFNRGGRIYHAKPDEVDTSGANITSLRFDTPISFALKAGDLAKGIRVSYDVDWSAVTATFTGQVKATWSVTVNGTVRKITKLYDVVKQVLSQPATWADVIALRPDADTQLSHVADKELLVTRAWDTVKQDLYTMGIRHNLIVPDDGSTLKDATVLQCLYNLTAHAGLPVPPSYMGQGAHYLDRLSRDKERALSLLQMPVDDNEDEIISGDEKNINRLTVYFRSPVNHRQKS